jgi:hypothetical protein
MNDKSLFLWKDEGRGLLAGVLLLAFLFCCGAVGASERYGMPSEQEARHHSGGGSTVEQAVEVKSLRMQEDRLFVNGEPYVLKRRTRVEDERGAKIRVEDIPRGAQIEVRYRTGSTLEDSADGPDARILTTIRIVELPEKETREDHRYRPVR